MAEALSAAGNIVKGIGGFVSSRQQSKALKAQAREELNAGAAQSLRVREVARKAIGEQLAAQSANGFMGGTGSALDAVMESQVNAALDAMTILRDAKSKSVALRYEAKMKRMEGNFALAAGMMNAASDVSGMRDDRQAASAGTTQYRDDWAQPSSGHAGVGQS